MMRNAPVVDQIVELIARPFLTQGALEGLGRPVDCADSGGVELQSARLPSLSIKSRDDRARRIDACVVGDHSVDTLASQAFRGGAAQPATATGDQDHSLSLRA